MTELETLGMVWPVHASAWEAGLDVARDYAAVHGHFLPPTAAVWGRDGFPHRRMGQKHAGGSPQEP
ncbi:MULTISPECIES: hypothetical protein [Streptomyces]|uniref:hypothetical protein n=1 Tax=Streptomyces TaxID=1883 RepID=UPI00177F58E2|nr:hypothetical protein [Streptomyces sp. 7G]MCA1270808.1 hypothetical protein [Streptomyces sp. 7G]GHE76335.1 hypothetical protein GCM10018782_57500 [Streptomyces griseoaurantiacus]